MSDRQVALARQDGIRAPAAYALATAARSRISEAFDGTPLPGANAYGGAPRGTTVPGVRDPDLLPVPRDARREGATPLAAAPPTAPARRSCDPPSDPLWREPRTPPVNRLGSTAR